MRNLNNLKEQVLGDVDEEEELYEIEGGSLEILPLKSWTTVWYQEENLQQEGFQQGSCLSPILFNLYTIILHNFH